MIEDFKYLNIIPNYQYICAYLKHIYFKNQIDKNDRKFTTLSVILNNYKFYPIMFFI